MSLNSLRTYYYTKPQHAARLLGIVIAMTGVIVGAMMGFLGPLITIAALVSLAIGLFAITSLDVAFWSVIGVITVLPYATLPFKIVLTPTFLDMALGGVILIYLLQWMGGKRRTINTTPGHLGIVALLLMAGVAFVAGMNNGALTSNVIRKFAEFLLSIAFVIIIVDYAKTQYELKTLTQVLAWGAAATSAIGLALYILPETVSQQILDALRVIGYYQNGGGLRYIEENPELAMRAIGFWVDPNAYGGTLAALGALLAPQLVAEEPIFKRRWLLYVMFGLVVLMTILTFSRSAMIGLVCAMLFVATLRYRKLLIILAVGAMIIFILPQTQAYVLRFVEGIRGEDLATQMRFGEYKDAFTLIRRYPWLGVGFAGTPDVDIYLGVSSMYLLLTQEMGVIGLLVFLGAMAIVFGWGLQNREVVFEDTALAPLWLGLHAGLIAILAIGVFDHYFVNLEFHSSQTIMWLFVGLALATTRLALQNKAQATNKRI